MQREEGGAEVGAEGVGSTWRVRSERWKRGGYYYIGRMEPSEWVGSGG